MNNMALGNVVMNRVMGLMNEGVPGAGNQGIPAIGNQMNGLQNQSIFQAGAGVPVPQNILPPPAGIPAAGNQMNGMQNQGIFQPAAGAPAAGNQANGLQNQGGLAGGGNANGKLQQAEQMAYAMLNGNGAAGQMNGMQGQGLAAANGKLANEATMIQQALTKNKPVMEVDDLDGAQGQTDGQTITIDEGFLEESPVAEVARTILHELWHCVLGGGTKDHEFGAESFAEDIMDLHGQGIIPEENEAEYMKEFTALYTDLPQNGPNILQKSLLA